MGWQPTQPLEIFAEAVSVPVMIHAPPRPTKVLAIGAYALPLAKLALRYPDTTEVVLMRLDGAPIPKDRRVRVVESFEELGDTKFDVAGIAVPGDPRELLGPVRSRLQPDGLMVVAVDQVHRARDTKDAMRPLFAQVLPYREHAPDLAVFLLGTGQRLHKPLRPIPPKLHRINPRYLPTMFSWPSDEYRMLWGEDQAQ